MTFTTYMATNGQFSFIVYDDQGEEFARGAGFPSQIEAEIAAQETIGPQAK